MDTSGHSSSLQPLNGMLQSTALASQDSGRYLHTPHPQANARVLELHAHRSDVLLERTRDGIDYLKFCGRHQWLAVPVQHLADLGTCPECAAEDDAGRGRRRYAELHMRGFQLRKAAMES